MKVHYRVVGDELKVGEIFRLLFQELLLHLSHHPTSRYGIPSMCQA